MGKRLLVLHGPNLNLLGEREGRQGGRLADLDAALNARATELGLELKVVQSNHEGVLIDTLHAERSRLEGVVVSPTGLFGSYPLREALEAVGVPALEVYLERLGERESVVAEACAATLEGQGFHSYIEALERFASGDLTGELTEEDEAAGDEEGEDEEGRGRVKTLGRRKQEIPQEKSLAVLPTLALVRSPGGTNKTLGRKVEAPAEPASSAKTLGRKVKGAQGMPASDLLTRALVRQKVADRLAGRLSAAELATWARSKWTEVQSGAPAESGYRDMLEDCLQQLTLSTMAASKLSDTQLLDMMTRLER